MWRGWGFRGEGGEDVVMEVESPVNMTGDQLKPLYQLIGRLLCMVDNKVHIQQMAATTRAGYMQMYNLVL